jgi:hypothetical protein
VDSEIVAGIIGGIIGVLAVLLGHELAQRSERHRRAGDLIPQIIILMRQFRRALHDGLLAQWEAKIHRGTSAPLSDQIHVQRKTCDAGSALDAVVAQIDAMGFLVELHFGKQGNTLGARLADLLEVRGKIADPDNPPQPEDLEATFLQAQAKVSEELRKVGVRLIGDQFGESLE